MNLDALLEFLHAAGGGICSHVHPLEGTPELPLCARCTGLYLACALGLFASSLLPARRAISGRTSLVIPAIFVGVTVAHALWATDAPDLERLAAGAAGGVGIAVLLGARLLPAATTAAALIVLAATRLPAVFTMLAIATPLALLAIVLTGAMRIADWTVQHAESAARGQEISLSGERENAVRS
jgi:uncharacterized membrane protein